MVLLCACWAGLASCFSRVRTLVLLDEANAGDAAFVKHDYAEAEKHYKAELAEAETNGPENRTTWRGEDTGKPKLLT